MAEVNIDVAKEESVQAVNTKVGTSSDTASSTPTTLFAGIKGLIAWFTGTWTAARAVKLDTIDIISTNTAYSATASSTGSLSQKMAYIISTLIGVTNATGGTTTAGTVMAKLNALLTSWTSTRAGYIDTIKTNTDYLKTQRQASLTGVGTTVFSGAPFPTGSVSSSLYFPAVLAKFIAPISGVYRFSVTGFYCDTIIKFGRSYSSYSYGGAGVCAYSNNVNPFMVYDMCSVGEILSFTPTMQTTGTSGFLYNNYPDNNKVLGSCYTILGEFTASSDYMDFYCEAGEPVVLCSMKFSTNSGQRICETATVTYQPI